MTTTFLFEKDGEGLYIGGVGNDLRFVVEGRDGFTAGVTLDQIGRDALLTYLEDREEEEEVEEQTERVMWQDVEF